LKSSFPSRITRQFEFDIATGWIYINEVMDKQEIKNRLQEAVKTAPHQADIKTLAIFGSYVSGTATEESDIDILIDFNPDAPIGFFALSDIKNHFESFLQKTVDLLTPQAISKYFRQNILSQAEYILK
jgi:hypothetical protein